MLGWAQPWFPLITNCFWKVLEYPIFTLMHFMSSLFYPSGLKVCYSRCASNLFQVLQEAYHTHFLWLKLLIDALSDLQYLGHFMHGRKAEVLVSNTELTSQLTLSRNTAKKFQFWYAKKSGKLFALKWKSFFVAIKCLHTRAEAVIAPNVSMLSYWFGLGMVSSLLLFQSFFGSPS